MTVSMVFTDIKRENMNYLANMIGGQHNYQRPNWQGFGQGGGSFMQQAPQQGFQPPQGMPANHPRLPRQGMNWGGGDPNFDERTGQPRQFNSIYG
jgi:hypothetical protein